MKAHPDAPFKTIAAEHFRFDLLFQDYCILAQRGDDLFRARLVATQQLAQVRELRHGERRLNAREDEEMEDALRV